VTGFGTVPGEASSHDRSTRWLRIRASWRTAGDRGVVTVRATAERVKLRTASICRDTLLITTLCVAGCPDDTADDTHPNVGQGATDDETADGDGDTDPAQDECAPDQLDGCPPDTKCTAIVAPDGLSYSFECVTDQADLNPGDPCMPMPPTGIDRCPTGYACIPDTNLIPTEGHCLELCLDDDGCPDGLCSAMPASVIRVCADHCDPILANCPATYACRMLEDRSFGCVLPLPADIGVQGTQCDGFNQLGCADGFVCMPSLQVPECLDPDFCCTAVCPVDGMADCPPGSLCQSLTLEDPLLEHIGVCAT
jgi:hypothetical protein